MSIILFWSFGVGTKAAMNPLDYLDYAFAQRAVIELVLLSVIAGAIGPWIVMRSLSFFAHAVGTAAFPGLVIATALGIAQPAGAAVGAGAVAIGAGLSSPSTRNSTRTGLWLSASLAIGAIAASTLGSGGSAVDSALFGSLLTLSVSDLVFAAIVATASLAAARLAGWRWLASGLLGHSASGRWETALVAIVAAAAVSQLAAAGALLASALLVLPAAAARPWVRSVSGWQRLSFTLALSVALGGLAIALAFNLPPGATIAMTAGVAVAASLSAATLLRSSARIAIPSALAALLVVGCASGEPSAGGKPEAIATTPIVASIVKAVAGNGVEVTTLVPAGADPHEFEPKPSDIAAVAGSSLIVANGGLDGWIEKVKQRAGSNTEVLDLLDGVPVKLESGHHGDGAGGHSEADHGKVDPHWFHDPRNVAAAAGTVATALAKLDPANAATYRTRAKAFAQRTRQLDTQGRLCIARLPAEQRKLVTDHDAFAYLAGRTGLQVVGTVIPSTSSSAAPSASELDALAKTIERLKIKAIFPETALDPKTAKAIAEQTGASAATQLDADTLGPPGSPRDSWAGMWTTNVSAIAKGLSEGRVTCSIGSVER